MNSDYLNVVISGDSFYIEETSDKPEGENALSTLKKIQEIVERNLPYSSKGTESKEHLEKYTKLSEKGNLIEFLRYKALEIRDGYIKKSASQWFNFSNQLKEVCDVVEETFPSRGSFPIPPEITDLIFYRLSLKEGRMLASVCTDLYSHNARDIEMKAAEMGYIDLTGEEKASQDYLKKLFSQVKQLIKDISIPEKYLVRRNDKSLDLEKTLKNLSTLDRKKQYEGTQLPLVAAANKGFLETVKALLIYGAQVDAKLDASETALFFAISYCQQNALEIVELLLANGADSNRLTKAGQSPLTSAILVSKKSIVELLLKHGADINKIIGFGQTPLTCAIDSMRLLESTDTDMVEFLLKNKADLSLLDGEGYSPLDWAEFLNNPKLIQLINEYSAKSSSNE